MNNPSQAFSYQLRLSKDRKPFTITIPTLAALSADLALANDQHHGSKIQTCMVRIFGVQRESPRRLHCRWGSKFVNADTRSTVNEPVEIAAPFE